MQRKHSGAAKPPKVELLSHIPEKSIAMSGQRLMPANRPPRSISFKITAAAFEERNFSHTLVLPSPSSLSIHTCMEDEECNLSPQYRECNDNKAGRLGEEKSSGEASRKDAGIWLPREQMEQENSVVMRLPREEVEQGTKERGEHRISSASGLLKMARTSNRRKKYLEIKEETPTVSPAGGAVCRNESAAVTSSKETNEKWGKKKLGLGRRFGLHRRFLSKNNIAQHVHPAKVMGQGPPAEVIEQDGRQSVPAVPETAVPSTPVRECVQMPWSLSRSSTIGTNNVNSSSTNTPTTTASSASTLEFSPCDVSITVTTRSRGTPFVLAPTMTVNNPPCSDAQAGATHDGQPCLLPPSMPDSINLLAEEEKDTLDNLNITSVTTNSDEGERAESHEAEVKVVVVEARITPEESPQEIELCHCNIDMDPNDDSPAATQIMSSAVSESGSLIDEVCTRDIGVIDDSIDVFVDVSSTTGGRSEAIAIEVSKFMSYDDISKDNLSESGYRHGASDTVSSMTSKASTAEASHKTHEVKKFENAIASDIAPGCYLETIEVEREHTANDMSALSENRILVFRKQQLENASTVVINYTFDTLPSLPPSVAHDDESTLSDKGSELDDIVETDLEDDDSLISKSSFHNDECRLMPCGIPREEIMEDLFDAFEDTMAHMKSQLLRSCDATERAIRDARDSMETNFASPSRRVGENRGRSHTVSLKRIGEKSRHSGNENRHRRKNSRGRSRTARTVRQERKNQLSTFGRRMEL